MTKKKAYLIIFIIFTLLIITVIYFINKKQEKTVELKVITLKTENGWGYDIVVDKKIFIHQEIIPAISGTKAFASENDAKKTGNLVAEKIKKGKIPYITIRELDSLQIKY